MLYGLLKVWVRLSLFIFCRKIVFHNKGELSSKGPLIIASNHPDSFPDALLIGDFMQQPVHFIARGDVFSNRLARFILHRLNMMPAYRIQDGKEKLSLNQQTFDMPVEALRK